MKHCSHRLLSCLLFSTILAPSLLSAKSITLSHLSQKVLLPLLASNSLPQFAGRLPEVKALSSFEGPYESCLEQAPLGLICTDADSFYIDDTLLLEGKEWSLKPPKTGIGFIDNNREIISGAVGGGLIGGPAGSLVGIFWGDKQQTQAKINELRQQNMTLQADVAQAKLDRATDAERFKTEKQVEVDANSCIRAVNGVYQLATQSLDGYLGQFNQCLARIDPNDVSGSNLAQICLDTYEASALAGLSAVKTLSNCL